MLHNISVVLIGVRSKVWIAELLIPRFVSQILFTAPNDILPHVVPESISKPEPISFLLLKYLFVLARGGYLHIDGLAVAFGDLSHSSMCVNSKSIAHVMITMSESIIDLQTYS